MQNDPNKEIAKLFLEARDAPPNPVAVANAFHPHALQPLNAVEAVPTFAERSVRVTIAAF